MEKREFSLIDVLQLLRKRWWIILLCSMLVAVGSGFLSMYTYKPTYSSSVSFYVSDSNSNDEQSSASEDVSQVNYALKAVKNYMELLKSDDFMEEISEAYEAKYPKEWERQNYRIARLSDSLVFTATEDTFIFTVEVTTRNKSDSYRIAQLVEELAPERIKTMTNRDALEVNDSARVASQPSNSNHRVRNALIGFLLGAILSFLVVFIIDISDARIKNEEDVTENYPFPLLGTIPNFEMALKKKKGYGYGKK